MTEKGGRPTQELVSRLSPEVAHGSSFRNVIFQFLDYPTMDKAKHPSNSACYTPLPEPFRILLHFIPYFTCLLNVR